MTALLTRFRQYLPFGARTARPARPSDVLKPASHVGLRPSFNQNTRTEDIRFSPSGRLLATVATDGILTLFEVDTSSRPVSIGRDVGLRSPSLQSPHGVDFLSEDVVVVANRSGCVTFYRIPGVDAWEDRMIVDPIHQMESERFGPIGATRKLKTRTIICGPGSVRAREGQLFVCCNYRNSVTAHPYTLRQDSVETHEGTIVAQSDLEIPDGVALSRDNRWMAVSNHDHRSIAIYRRPDGKHSCMLRDPELGYPHGLCFDPSGRRLYVADAGGRYIHVFVTQNDWQAADRSAFKLVAVKPDALRKTKEAVAEQIRPLEGGIKGMDVDPSGRILATTCRHQSPRFFEIQPHDS